MRGLGTKMRAGQQNDPRILVDPEDAWLLEYKWHLVPHGSRRYVQRTVRHGGARVNLALHRVILDAPIAVDVDHINGNGLDNRRCNLRLGTRSQNLANTPYRTLPPSGYRGVRPSALGRTRKGQTWVARQGGRYLGLFSTPKDAARAYDQEAIRTYGEFAVTNENLGLYSDSGKC